MLLSFRAHRAVCYSARRVMQKIQQSFQVRYSYPVVFTRRALSVENEALRAVLPPPGRSPHKALLVVDSGVEAARPGTVSGALDWARANSDVLVLAGEPLVVAGGEACKSRPELVERVHGLVRERGLCRQSFVWIIGGGAVLDACGYAAATAHRGMRVLRMPTTLLAQNDAGIGVKNGVNVLGRKNFVGTFAPPFAVVNDLDFLETLEPRDLRSGMAEAVKVAAIKDAGFFGWLHAERARLARFDSEALERLALRCAELHLEHIRSGDPFETGSSRPLDFGHWSAHGLEQATGGELRHGEAVAVGIALDSLYASRMGLLGAPEASMVLETLSDMGLSLFHPALESLDIPGALCEFQEHIGGELTITLPSGLGRKVEVHEVDASVMKECVRELARRAGGIEK